jgi:hypothetical protein
MPVINVLLPCVAAVFVTECLQLRRLMPWLFAPAAEAATAGAAGGPYAVTCSSVWPSPVQQSAEA